MNTALLAIFMSVSNTFNLPPGLLGAICKVESSYVVNAIHKDDGSGDSLGLCQLHLSTARWMGYRGSERNLRYSAPVNAYYAGKYLRHLLGRYDSDVLRAISAYNAGTYTVTNKKYVQRVVKAWAQAARGDKYAIKLNN